MPLEFFEVLPHPTVGIFQFLLGFILWVFLALPVFAESVMEDPLDRQVLEIAKDLRCAVCQNQPIAESNADLARDMRAIIREKLMAGKSRDEIVGYFVERYGDYVLMSPPTSGPGRVVWVMPVLLLLIIGVSGFMFLRHRLRVELPPVTKLTKADAERVRAAREENKK